MENNHNLKQERIAKRIAHLGYCSRREAEKLILEKKVAVNNLIITTPAFLVSKEDVISIDGKKLKPMEQTRLFAYYKPKGLICSNKDEEGRETIFDDLKRYENLPRLVYVGRLDYNSEGLLLLTNNGELSNQLSSPKNFIKRVYKVRAFGKVTEKQLDALSFGVEIEGIKYKPIIAHIINSSRDNIWLEFTLTEGKNREIRKICEYLGLQVNRLIRTSFGDYKLNNMQEGDLIEVDPKHLNNIITKHS